MKKIEYLILFMVGILLVFPSCNHKNEQLYQKLPIVKEYEPEYYIFDRDEISKEELNEMPNLKLVINNEDEFPQDNLMGLDEIKESKIDFQKYTLLLVYYKLPGVILDCKCDCIKDFENNIIFYSINFHLDQDTLKNPEISNLFTYYRSAILVSKLQEDTEVEFRLSY